jgi:hypothetical protein
MMIYQRIDVVTHQSPRGEVFGFKCQLLKKLIVPVILILHIFGPFLQNFLSNAKIVLFARTFNYII